MLLVEVFLLPLARRVAQAGVVVLLVRGQVVVVVVVVAVVVVLVGVVVVVLAGVQGQAVRDPGHLLLVQGNREAVVVVLRAILGLAAHVLLRRHRNNTDMRNLSGIRNSLGICFFFCILDLSL